MPRPARWTVAALALFAARPALAQQAPPVSTWPLRIDTAAGQLSIYQPQPDTFEGDQLSARAAVSLAAPGATDPEFGATWFSARVFTDRDARTVTIQDVTVRQVKLPSADAGQEAQFAATIKQQLASLNVTFSLDQLEATLTDVQKARVESQQLDNAPPRIVFTQTPTTLVVLDGDPKLQPADDLAGGPGVLRVVNTPFILLLHGPSKTYFLKAGDAWMAAPDVAGPWQPAAGVPREVDAVGAKLSVQNQQAPGQPAAAAAPASAVATQIMVATTPTELVSSNGPPQYTPLPGNDLLYMANTAADVFLEVATQRTFVLLSGRWYSAPGTNGPWQYVASNALPPSFAQIPADSPKANVLVSVAGTQRALDARTDAYIPQTTAIRRDSGANLTVSYDGEPKFEPVQDTPITYATNCPDPVLYVDRSYYCCHQAVWYQSAAAVGPWVVSTGIPQVIYTLPPSCPVYHCRYVYVYDSTPDVVYCGYLPGYTGCYVYGPTVVYGTGYRYGGWYGREYIPRPCTYGFAPRYDYGTATWGFGVGRHYGPTWFAAGRDEPARRDWFGPQGYVDYREIHRTTVVNNYYGGDRGGDRRADDRGVDRGGDRGGRDAPRGPAVVNNSRNVTVNNINIYNRQENVTRNVTVNRTRNDVRNVDVHNDVRNDTRNNNVRVNNDNRNDNRPDNRGPDNRGPDNRGPDNRGADNRTPVVSRGSSSDDVYAGRDGQVYRRTDQGWQQRGSKGWSNVTPPAQAPRADARPGPTNAPAADDRRGGGTGGDDARRRNGAAENPPPVRTPSPGTVDPRSGNNPQRQDTPRGDTPRGETPARRADPPAVARDPAPARTVQPADPTGGLDQDRAARQRGAGGRRSGGGDDNGGGGTSTPPARSAGGGSGGTPPARSGGGGGPSAPSDAGSRGGGSHGNGGPAGTGNGGGGGNNGGGGQTRGK